MASSFKEDILNHIEEILREKETDYLKALESLKQDLTSASKSSAGDKHETGRAMVHLEQEKLGKQVLNTQKDLKTIQLMRNNQSEKTALGSMLITDGPTFLLGIGLGIIKLEEQEVVCVSMLSPIAQNLARLKSGDSFTFGKKTLSIKDIS